MRSIRTTLVLGAALAALALTPRPQEAPPLSPAMEAR